MTRNDFIQEMFTVLVTSETPIKNYIKIVERCEAGAETLESSGFKFDLPPDAEFDQAGYDAMAQLLHDSAEEGSIRKGMAGPCLTIHEMLTTRLFTMLGKKVPDHG